MGDTGSTHPPGWSPWVRLAQALVGGASGAQAGRVWVCMEVGLSLASEGKVAVTVPLIGWTFNRLEGRF